MTTLPYDPEKDCYWEGDERYKGIRRCTYDTPDTPHLAILLPDEDTASVWSLYVGKEDWPDPEKVLTELIRLANNTYGDCNWKIHLCYTSGYLKS